MRARGSPYRNLPVGLLLGCALLLRAMIPAGWMPAGGFGIDVCVDGTQDSESARFTAEAQRLFRQALAGTVPAHDRSDGKDGAGKSQPCAFAGLALPWIGAEAPRLIPPRPAPEIAPPGLAAVAVGRGLAAPPPPSTGPPAHA